MEQFTDITLKGFVIPPGYRLRIVGKSGEEKIKTAGDFSGGQYRFVDILNGAVPNWYLEKDFNEDSNYFDPIQTGNEIYSIANDIRGVGGEVLFVGGVVRDKQLGKQSKDIDLEVYNVDSDSLQKILSNYGKVDTVGSSFGVIKLTTETNDYDFTLPRRENKSGEGHRGFIVEPDPTMTPKDAAERRDFTFNGLAMTVEGRVLDYFDGLKDLHKRRLRHISNKFAEDPLRVLRGFQFAARFDLTMAKETAELCRSIKNEYKTLPVERIWTEWQKWAEKGQKPSAGLKVLRETGWLEFYPELHRLIGIPQEERWHPEGDVWTHTNFVVDMAAEIAERENLESEDRLVLVLAALCHDLGKVSTTQNIEGEWRAPGHATEGEEPTRALLQRIGAPRNIIEKVVPLVREHMSHLNEINPRTIRRLSLRLTPASVKMLGYVIESDHSGRPPLPKVMPDRAREMVELAETLSLREEAPKPIVGGRHLLELAKKGKIPKEFASGGPHFKKFLDLVFEAQIDGAFEDEKSGLDYVVSLLDEESSLNLQNKLVFLAGRSFEEKQKLAVYANDNGLDEEGLMRLTVEDLKRIIETS